jgi:hypothetical protein
MKKPTAITCVFLDIGVLAHRRWDRHARKRAATNFKLELAEMEDRYHLRENLAALIEIPLQDLELMLQYQDFGFQPGRADR